MFSAVSDKSVAVETASTQNLVEGDTENIQLREIKKDYSLKITKTKFDLDGNNTPYYGRYIATSNNYGYTVVGKNKTLHLFFNRAAQEFLNSKPILQNEAPSDSIAILDTKTSVELNIPENTIITHVSLMGSEEKILVCLSNKSIILFEASEIQKVYFALLFSSGISNPLKSFTIENEIYDLAPNPDSASNIISILTFNQSVLILDVVTSKVSNLAPNLSATSICWSRKGKQLSVGNSSNSIKTFSISGELKRNIQLPTSDLSILSLLWIDNFTFLSISGNAPTDLTSLSDYEHNYSLTLATQLNKRSPLEFYTFDDPCPAWGLQSRGPQRYFADILNYGNEFEYLLFISASASTDVATIGKVLVPGSQTEYTWKLLNLPENFRAILPFSKIDDSSDTAPLGMTIDLTSTTSLPPLHPEESNDRLNPLPILWILNTDGFLLGYHIYNVIEAEKNVKFSKMVESLPNLPTSSGSVPFSQQASAPSTENTSSFGSSSFGKSALEQTSSQPSFGSFTLAPNPSISNTAFGSSSFGQKTDKPAFGSSSFGQAAPAQPAFGTSAFGQAANKPAFGTSTFGQSSDKPAFGTSTFGQSTDKPAFGASAFGQSTDKPALGTSAFGQSSDKPAFGSSAFGQSADKPAFGTSAFGQSTDKPAFGTSAFGQSTDKPAFGTSAFGQSTDKPAFGTSAFGQSTNKPAFGTSAFGQSTDKPAFGTSAFGQSSDKSAFGSSAFGQSTNKPAFGTSAFGQKTDEPPFGGSSFGQSSDKPAFGSSSFGQAASNTQSAFGTSAFGQSTAKSANGAPSLAKKADNSTFGSSSFSQAADKPAFGSSAFGQSTSQSAFGTSSFDQTATNTSNTISAFGQSTTKPAFGASAFGQSATTQSAFGTSSFGQKTSQASLDNKPSSIPKISNSTLNSSLPSTQIDSQKSSVITPSSQSAFGQASLVSAFGQATTKPESEKPSFGIAPNISSFGKSAFDQSKAQPNASKSAFGVSTTPSDTFNSNFGKSVDLSSNSKTAFGQTTVQSSLANDSIKNDSKPTESSIPASEQASNSSKFGNISLSQSSFNIKQNSLGNNQRIVSTSKQSFPTSTFSGNNSESSKLFGDSFSITNKDTSATDSAFSAQNDSLVSEKKPLFPSFGHSKDKLEPVKEGTHSSFSLSKNENKIESGLYNSSNNTDSIISNASKSQANHDSFKDSSKIQVEGLKTAVPRKPASGSHLIPIPSLSSNTQPPDDKNKDDIGKVNNQLAENLSQSRKAELEALEEERRIRLQTYQIIVKQFQSSCLQIDQEFINLSRSIKKNESLFEKIGVPPNKLRETESSLLQSTNNVQKLGFYSSAFVKDSIKNLKLGDKIGWDYIIKPLSATLEDSAFRTENLKLYLSMLKSRFYWIEMRKDLFMVLLEKRESLFNSNISQHKKIAKYNSNSISNFGVQTKTKFEIVKSLIAALESKLDISYNDSNTPIPTKLHDFNFYNRIKDDCDGKSFLKNMNDYELNKKSIINGIDFISITIQKKRDHFSHLLKSLKSSDLSKDYFPQEKGVFNSIFSGNSASNTYPNNSSYNEFSSPTVYGIRTTNAHQLTPVSSVKKNRTLSLQSNSKAIHQTSENSKILPPSSYLPDNIRSTSKHINNIPQKTVEPISSSDYLKTKKRRNLLMAQMTRAIGNISINQVGNYIESSSQYEKSVNDAEKANVLSQIYSNEPSDLSIHSLIESIRAKRIDSNILNDLKAVSDFKSNDNRINFSEQLPSKLGLFTDGIAVEFNKNKHVKTPKVDSILKSMEDFSIEAPSRSSRLLNFDTDSRLIMPKKIDSLATSENLQKDSSDNQAPNAETNKFSADKYWCCSSCRSFNEIARYSCSACGNHTKNEKYSAKSVSANNITSDNNVDLNNKLIKEVNSSKPLFANSPNINDSQSKVLLNQELSLTPNPEEQKGIAFDFGSQGLIFTKPTQSLFGANSPTVESHPKTNLGFGNSSNFFKAPNTFGTKSESPEYDEKRTVDTLESNNRYISPSSFSFSTDSSKNNEAAKPSIFMLGNPSSGSILPSFGAANSSLDSTSSPQVGKDNNFFKSGFSSSAFIQSPNSSAFGGTPFSKSKLDIDQKKDDSSSYSNSESPASQELSDSGNDDTDGSNEESDNNYSPDSSFSDSYSNYSNDSDNSEYLENDSNSDIDEENDNVYSDEESDSSSDVNNSSSLLVNKNDPYLNSNKDKLLEGNNIKPSKLNNENNSSSNSSNEEFSPNRNINNPSIFGNVSSLSNSLKNSGISFTTPEDSSITSFKPNLGFFNPSNDKLQAPSFSSRFFKSDAISESTRGTQPDQLLSNQLTNLSMAPKTIISSEPIGNSNSTEPIDNKLLKKAENNFKNAEEPITESNIEFQSSPILDNELTRSTSKTPTKSTIPLPSQDYNNKLSQSSEILINPPSLIYDEQPNGTNEISCTTEPGVSIVSDNDLNTLKKIPESPSLGPSKALISESQLSFFSLYSPKNGDNPYDSDSNSKGGSLGGLSPISEEGKNESPALEFNIQGPQEKPNENLAFDPINKTANYNITDDKSIDSKTALNKELPISQFTGSGDDANDNNDENKPPILLYDSEKQPNHEKSEEVSYEANNNHDSNGFKNIPSVEPKDISLSNQTNNDQKDFPGFSNDNLSTIGYTDLSSQFSEYVNLDSQPEVLISKLTFNKPNDVDDINVDNDKISPINKTFVNNESVTKILDIKQCKPSKVPDLLEDCSKLANTDLDHNEIASESDSFLLIEPEESENNDLTNEKLSRNSSIDLTDTESCSSSGEKFTLKTNMMPHEISVSEPSQSKVSDLDTFQNLTSNNLSPILSSKNQTTSNHIENEVVNTSEADKNVDFNLNIKNLSLNTSEKDSPNSTDLSNIKSTSLAQNILATPNDNNLFDGGSNTSETADTKKIQDVAKTKATLFSKARFLPMASAFSNTNNNSTNSLANESKSPSKDQLLQSKISNDPYILSSTLSNNDNKSNLSDSTSRFPHISPVGGVDTAGPIENLTDSSTFDANIDQSHHNLHEKDFDLNANNSSSSLINSDNLTTAKFSPKGQMDSTSPLLEKKSFNLTPQKNTSDSLIVGLACSPQALNKSPSFLSKIIPEAPLNESVELKNDTSSQPKQNISFGSGTSFKKSIFSLPNKDTTSSSTKPETSINATPISFVSSFKQDTNNKSDNKLSQCDLSKKIEMSSTSSLTKADSPHNITSSINVDKHAPVFGSKSTFGQSFFPNTSNQEIGLLKSVADSSVANKSSFASFSGQSSGFKSISNDKPIFLKTSNEFNFSLDDTRVFSTKKEFDTDSDSDPHSSSNNSSDDDW
ncbi:Nucleoporin [Smittium culicis]|uniref:Nucleoporin n=1 Tax=Smittium culicis TaxID=133412 RepID=A0A1R1YQ98_9FUNG|nr:Nucleoporin [Smittium culicis]